MTEFLKIVNSTVINEDEIFYENITARTVKKMFINDLEWLINESKKHFSIDTFAKKLFLNNKPNELAKLKSILSCFIIGQQEIERLDYRYDLFFASILNKENNEIILPDNIRILTWNYDTQFEKSFANFYSNLITQEQYFKLQSIPISRDYKIEINCNKFSIIHLNGICEVYDDNKYLDRYSLNYRNVEVSSIVTEILYLYSFYNQKRTKITPHINYAWEDNIYKKIIYPQIEGCINKTEILVVIGYSFPFFNRLVDKDILSKLPSLKQVFIQCKSDDHKAMKDRFCAIYNKDVEINMISDLKQFYIPYEYK